MGQAHSKLKKEVEYLRELCQSNLTSAQISAPSTAAGTPTTKMDLATSLVTCGRNQSKRTIQIIRPSMAIVATIMTIFSKLLGIWRLLYRWLRCKSIKDERNRN